jgi:Polyketide cyclase / dehydrase and lipid transport
MGVDVITEITIKRPRDEVSAFTADASNATAWYKNIKAVEWETPPPAVVGSRVRFRAQFLGRTLEYTYEVREIEPGTRFVMATAQGAFPMETTYTCPGYLLPPTGRYSWQHHTDHEQHRPDCASARWVESRSTHRWLANGQILRTDAGLISPEG